MTSDVIERLGQPGVLVHGVSIEPGKPTILAVCDGKPVFGLPGDPSARWWWVTCSSRRRYGACKAASGHRIKTP